MSEATQNPAPRKKATSLTTMLLADLKALAGGLGIDGAASMKKAQLVDAIKHYQDAHSSAPRASKPETAKAAPQREETGARSDAQPSSEPAAPAAETATEEKPKVTRRARGQNRSVRSEETAAAEGSSEPASATSHTGEEPSESRVQGQRGRGQGRAQERGPNAAEPSEETRTETPASSSEGVERGGEQAGENPVEGGERRGRNRNRNRDRQGAEGLESLGRQDKGESQKQNQKGESPKSDSPRSEGQKKAGNQGGGQNQNSGQRNDGQKNEGQKNEGQKNEGPKHDGQGQYDDEFDEDGGSRRNRRRRGRDRLERVGRNEPDTTILDDDVLVPAAGILDVLDNYAFVRTSGYLPGPDDVYLSLSMVRKYGLRRGDAVVGQVRQPREGERREKFNPMVRIDTVNGLDPEEGTERPEFDAFVPVHPNTRLRLETGPDNLLGRIVDVLAPIGKGQRGMVLSPPRSGKTQVLQTIAAAIRHNNPECHVMVVLIDERPEEVTDYQRTVRGEVVASTFDRPAADHVLLAELAVERAKRLVEMGHDVVVLLDSLTRLARAFNVTAPGSGRQGAGGVDPVALHPAKRLFGAARNVEDGGSLTILATALVDSGSPLDEAVLDEFNDTGNMDLRLRRELVERRIFPPVDVVASGTRREEQLLSPEEQQLTFKLRSALDDLDPRDALERVVARMTATATNVEFLAQVQKASIAELAGK